MQITAPIYGYIGGAYYTGYATPQKNMRITGKVKPAISPVEKPGGSKSATRKN